MYNFKKYLVVLYSHKMKSKCGVLLTNEAHGGIGTHVAQLLNGAPAGLKPDGDRDRAPGKPALSLATRHSDHRFCPVSHQKIFVYIRRGVNKENLFYFLKIGLSFRNALYRTLRSSTRADRFVELPGRCNNGILHKLPDIYQIFRSI